MKIIKTDNYARETVADDLVAENITNKYLGQVMVEALQQWPGRNPDVWYQLVADDYRLGRGMEDIV